MSSTRDCGHFDVTESVRQQTADTLIVISILSVSLPIAEFIFTFHSFANVYHLLFQIYKQLRRYWQSALIANYPGAYYLSSVLATRETLPQRSFRLQVCGRITRLGGQLEFAPSENHGTRTPIDSKNPPDVVAFLVSCL